MPKGAHPIFGPFVKKMKVWITVIDCSPKFAKFPQSLLHPLNETKMYQMEGCGMKMQSFVEDFGFAYIVVSEYSISWQFVNCNLEIVYEYTRYK